MDARETGIRKPTSSPMTSDRRWSGVNSLPARSAEIAAFFDAAASYSPPSPMAWEAKCLFGLMHSCGLRTCEAMRLRREDVDLDECRIDVMWSKGHRSRRLAITGDIAEMLGRCDAATSLAVGASRATFFATSTGNQLTGSTVGQAFHRIWDLADFPIRRGESAPGHMTFVITSRTPTSSAGAARAATSWRCCPTSPDTWGMPPSTAPTTTCTPRRTSWRDSRARSRRSTPCFRRWVRCLRETTRQTKLTSGAWPGPSFTPIAQGSRAVLQDRGSVPISLESLHRLRRRGRRRDRRGRHLRPRRPRSHQGLGVMDERAARVLAKDGGPRLRL